MDHNHNIILIVGEKLHIMTRRNFATDHSRHFVGVVASTNGTLARLKGYTFVFNPDVATYQKIPEVRTRIFGLDDGQHIINVMPPHAIIDALHYSIMDDRLVLSDGAKFSMDVNEFGELAN